MVVVISVREAWKAISSWQHIGATWLSCSGNLGICHRNHCHFYMQKTEYENAADWKNHMLSFGLFTSHPTPHCPALPAVFMNFCLEIRLSLSLPFFFSVSNVFNSFNSCLPSTCYMKDTVLGTREIETYK